MAKRITAFHQLIYHSPLVTPSLIRLPFLYTYRGGAYKGEGCIGGVVYNDDDDLCRDICRCRTEILLWVAAVSRVR
jgi:hypothetical protein